MIFGRRCGGRDWVKCGFGLGRDVACRIAVMSEPKMQMSGMFSEPTGEKSFPTAAVTIAVVVIAVAVAVLMVMSRHARVPAAPTTLQPLAAYASKLEMSNIQMSEATSPTGGKSTYIDGRVTNHGAATVTGITVQLVFGNDEQMPAQLETEGLPLVYMRDPYIDTRPVSAAPLAPAAGADFRLVFENIRPNWNQMSPEIRVTKVSIRQ
jgi:hypothetical protein